MSSEVASLIPPFTFPSSSLLLTLFSARGHSEAGLKLGDGVLEVTRHLLEFFIYQRAHACGLFASTSFRLLQKNKNDVKKFSHFVTSSTL